MKRNSVLAASMLSAGVLSTSGYCADWSGVYLGGNLGYQITDSSFNHVEGGGTTNEAFTNKPNSVVGGAQLSGRYQLENRLVFGGEFSYLARNKEDSSFTNLNNTPRDRFSKVKDIWSLAATSGYAFDDSLLYVKAGAARTELTYRQLVRSTGAQFGSTDSVWGYTIGTGLEYALTPAWSLGIDYNYYHFNVGNQRQNNLSTGAYGNADNTNNSLSTHAILARINFKIF